ncbi:putative ribosomal protein L1 [Helianthus debilis subsp. tardiflorus]
MAAIPPSIDAAAAAAVDALLKWKTKQSDSQNPQLLPQDDFIYLNLTLKKIPQKGSINGPRANPNKIPLPHPIVSTNFSEICLIIDDRPTSKLTSAIAKKKIKEEGISVTKVLKLSKLRTDYKPFEAKRKLCDSYDMFFADKRVVTLLPKGVEEVEEDGEKKKKKSKKGRIHEMDLDVNEDDEGEAENENDENVDVSDGGLGKKKRKGDGIEVEKKKKKSKKGKGVEVEVSRDSDDEVVEELKPAKKSMKEKKRKGDVIEESDVSAKSNDKIAKKKGKKVGDSGKKEKKKGRSVSRV